VYKRKKNKKECKYDIRSCRRSILVAHQLPIIVQSSHAKEKEKKTKDNFFGIYRKSVHVK